MKGKRLVWYVASDHDYRVFDRRFTVNAVDKAAQKLANKFGVECYYYNNQKRDKAHRKGKTMPVKIVAPNRKGELK